MMKLKGTIAAVLGAAVVISSISFDAADARSRKRSDATAAAVITLFGAVAAGAAANRYRDRSYYGEPYYGGPAYYGPGHGYGGYREYHGHPGYGSVPYSDPRFRNNLPADAR